MPFLSGRSTDVCPPNFDWGEPKGRLVAVFPFRNEAIYVIEKEPSILRVDAKLLSGTIHGHDIHFPWMYYVIKAHWTSRVCGTNAGYLFFAKEKVTDLGAKVLLRPVFPNVFQDGSLCLGYTVSFRDRSPIRSVWRAIRYFEGTPGNDFMVGLESVPDAILSKSSRSSCSAFDKSWVSYFCRWHEFGKEWQNLDFKGLWLSINDVKSLSFLKQPYKVITEGTEYLHRRRQ